MTKMAPKILNTVSIIFIFCSLGFAHSGSLTKTQQSSTPDPEVRKQKVVELNRKLDELDRKAADIEAQRKAITAERLQLLQVIANEDEQSAFKSSPSYVVMGVPNDQSVTLLINGREQTVSLTGTVVKLGYGTQAIEFLKSKLRGGLAYIRCTGGSCSDAFIYASRDEPSLNAQLINKGFALPLRTLWPSNLQSEFSSSIGSDSAPSEGNNPSIGPTSLPPSSSSPGTEVQVKGYYRKDGTYVRPHTRSAPRRKN